MRSTGGVVFHLFISGHVLYLRRLAWVEGLNILHMYSAGYTRSRQRLSSLERSGLSCRHANQGILEGVDLKKAPAEKNFCVPAGLAVGSLQRKSNKMDGRCTFRARLRKAVAAVGRAGFVRSVSRYLMQPVSSKVLRLFTIARPCAPLKPMYLFAPKTFNTEYPRSSTQHCPRD